MAHPIPLIERYRLSLLHTGLTRFTGLTQGEDTRGPMPRFTAERRAAIVRLAIASESALALSGDARVALVLAEDPDEDQDDAPPPERDRPAPRRRRPAYRRRSCEFCGIRISSKSRPDVRYCRRCRTSIEDGHVEILFARDQWDTEEETPLPELSSIPASCPRASCRSSITSPYVWTCRRGSWAGICEGIKDAHFHAVCPCCGYEQLVTR